MTKETEQEYIEILYKRIRPLEKYTINKFYQKELSKDKEKMVDILGLAKALSIKVYLPPKGTTLDGWIEFNEDTEDKFEIYLNQQYEASRQRFTLAHEISHFLFHQEDIINVGQIDRGYISRGVFDQREWEADLYATELLMPTDMLDNLLKNDKNQYYLNNIDNLTQYLLEKAKVPIENAFKRAKRAIEYYKLINNL